MGEVVRRPIEGTGEENRDVDATDEAVVGELLGKEVEGNGQNSADQESVEQNIVGPVGAVHASRAESSPNDRGGEEGGRSWASETSLGLGSADTLNLGDLPVKDSHGDSGREESGNGLGHEEHTRRNFGVVTENG